MPKSVENYMNTCNSLFRTIKEGKWCIERLWISWKHGEKTSIVSHLFYRENESEAEWNVWGKYQSGLSDTNFISYRRTDDHKRKNTDCVWWSTALWTGANFAEIFLRECTGIPCHRGWQFAWRGRLGRSERALKQIHHI